MNVRKVVDRILVRHLEGKRPLGTHRCRWDDNIKTELQGGECVGMELIEKY